VQVGLCRAARTDAGVHAAYNVLALKMILSPPGMPADSTLEDYINTFLPPTVRVWSIIRVQGGFDPRKICDQRRYEYTLPTHVLLGPKPGTPMHTWLEKARTSAKPSAAVSSAVPNVTRGAPLQEAAPVPSANTAPEEEDATSGIDASAKAAIAESNQFWASQPADNGFEADIVAKKGWRISPGLLDSARDFVKAYEGSHNFYNFTVGKDFRDRSCQRTMRALKVGRGLSVPTGNGLRIDAVFTHSRSLIHLL
jgi:tRNA pseudouridine38-40 synthase